HTDLAAPLFQEFSLSIHYDLQVMRPGQSLSGVCSRILERIDEILIEEAPDCVLVQGDTTSALAGALGAFHRGIPVGHIEAGLRSGDAKSPFPEEMNRRLISQMADLHFASTERNRRVLLEEGIKEETVYVTGNPVLDSVLQIVGREGMSEELEDLLAKTEGSRRLVVTAHRRENFAGAMSGYFAVLKGFLEANEDVSMIFPVHPNPNVRRISQEVFGGVPNAHLVEPMIYPDFIRLLSHAWLIVSDSGGVQEEAPTLETPLLVIRENTERPEAIACGAAKLIGESPETLREHLEEIARTGGWAASMKGMANPFGRGDSRIRIVDAIGQQLRQLP
ncbi:MAG: UDP-N-acetylglucosamine 2-epimerase (non-hydrolyzing), partial [Verrucomicrobiota bacterium]